MNNHGSKKWKIGQRDQQLKVQVHGDDQSPHPGRLHGASLATAMQRPCRPVREPLETGVDTHGVAWRRSRGRPE